MSLSLHRQQLYWHNTCWMTMQIWRFTIIIFKTVHSTYIQSYSANIKPRGQTMTQCSILIYPLHPAQPTNEASSWLIAQSNDIHSVLLSQQMRPVHDSYCWVQWYPLHPAQPMRPVHDSMPSPMIYPSVLLSQQMMPVCPLFNPQWSTVHSVQLSQQMIRPVYTDDPVSRLVLSGMETTSAFIAWAVVAWCCSIFICQQSTYLVQTLDCSNLPKFTVAVI